MIHTLDHDECELRFDRYGVDDYQQFLRAKAIPEFRIVTGNDGISQGLRFPSRFAHLVGIEVQSREQQRLPMPDFLLDDQRAIVAMALDAKRFADWKDCGLGKTLEQAEWARQVAHITGKRVLVVTFSEIVPSWIDEVKKFYGDTYQVYRIETRQDLRSWCRGDSSEVRIAITNYEKFNPTDGLERIPEIGLLGGIALDESSRLKTGGGKQKWSIIKSSRGVPYKLSATGTPAPNDVMEFASQASFLERIRDENDVIWTYFTRGKDNEWTVKKHARPHFFRWMASWSIYVADPRAYGWRINSPDIPQPEFIYEEIDATDDQIKLQHAASAGVSGTGDLFGDRRLGMVSQLQLLEAAKGFIYTGDSYQVVESRKPRRVTQIACDEISAGRQTLIWCEYDAEVEILAAHFRYVGLKEGKDFATLGGSTPKSKRLEILEAFRQGRLPLLISKARLLGWGMNFQNCRAMIFSGFSDSFESFYQAVRRSYRYGQTEKLRVFIPYVQQLEGPVLRNLLNKVARFSELIKEQQEAYLAARKELAA